MKELKRLTRNNLSYVVRDNNMAVINAIKAICDYRLTKNSSDYWMNVLSDKNDKLCALAIKYLDNVHLNYHNYASPFDKQSNVLNILAECHGLEYLGHTNNGKGKMIYYLNSGDCYANTLINLEGEWYVGNIGDLLENHPKIKHDNPY